MYTVATMKDVVVEDPSVGCLRKPIESAFYVPEDDRDADELADETNEECVEARGVSD